MKVHVLQHVPFEDIGSMAPWLAAREATVSYTRFFDADTLPPPDGFDLVIAMGGPMSVNDEALLPWLKAEKRFLHEVIAAGTAVIGVCLGAQLLASALGARVYRNREREIGWFDIEGRAAGAGLFRFPDLATVFHWHGETFELPPGATHLASSAACDNQAFQLGERVIGMQFHVETTPESAEALIAHCGNELDGGGAFVQDAAALRAATPATYDGANRLMADVLTYVTR